MKPEQITVMQNCSARSLAGSITFPEVVQRLTEIGVERYHADYCRQVKTYYLPDGESLVVAMPEPPAEIAVEFSAAGIEAALRAIQRGEIAYPEFLRRTRHAGCVGYIVHIVGRRTIYFGRSGDIHVEYFPSPKK